RGILEKASLTMPVVRQWLHDHPPKMWEIMWQNASYIFFRETTAGPTGTEQVPLTPNRSLAVDPGFVPLGTPVFVSATLPATSRAPLAPFHKLLIAQDT